MGRLRNVIETSISTKLTRQVIAETQISKSCSTIFKTKIESHLKLCLLLWFEIFRHKATAVSHNSRQKDSEYSYMMRYKNAIHGVEVMAQELRLRWVENYG